MFNLNHRYEPLAPTNESHPPWGRIIQRCFSNTTSCCLLVWLITVVVSAGIGVHIGSRLDHNEACQPSRGSYSNPSIPLPTYKKAFTYNRTFGADPSEDANTQRAWNSIVPLGQGTVRYPTPDTDQIYYTVSAVHQLHCLWSIHQSYYQHSDHRVMNRDHVGKRNASEEEKEKQHEHAPRHMRHCFDYLRQSLMCAADATLEPVDAALGGVTGWGAERVCRDYTALAAWATERRASNAQGFS